MLKSSTRSKRPPKLISFFQFFEDINSLWIPTERGNPILSKSQLLLNKSAKQESKRKYFTSTNNLFHHSTNLHLAGRWTICLCHPLYFSNNNIHSVIHLSILKVKLLIRCQLQYNLLRKLPLQTSPLSCAFSNKCSWRFLPKAMESNEQSNSKVMKTFIVNTSRTKIKVRR